jgi:hypothetical protein
MLEVIPVHIPKAHPLEPKEATDLVVAYLALTPSVAERISVAIERLSLALRRHHPADRAVELSIALESLLSDQLPNEVTHKVKVRATRLLGGSEETRALNFGIIGRTYEIRSILVHTGKKEVKSKSIESRVMSPEEVTTRCAKLCVQIIKRIIFAKEFPSWASFDIN